MTRIFAGVDLSQAGLALVTSTPEAVAELDWGAMGHVTIGESLPADATPLQLAQRLVKLRHAAILWLRKRSPTDVVFEAYPNGGGKQLHNVTMVAEMGGTLRASIAENFGIGATASPEMSARKLLLGSLSTARLAQALRGTNVRPTDRGARKAAIWAEVRRMGAPFKTSDEADAFVAMNYGLYQAELPCLAGVS